MGCKAAIDADEYLEELEREGRATGDADAAAADADD
jgi:thioredoxin reductase (NADPH)